MTMNSQPLPRRNFLGSALTAASGLCFSPGLALATSGLPPASRRPIPVIHVTDLFRPHDDPDDHWDLACVYALAWQGRLDLKAVFVDDPKPERPNDPDVLAVAQLNYLTGKAVPILVGSPQWIKTPSAPPAGTEQHLRGIKAMLDLMRQSPDPVVINILGSCRDVAMAGRLEPELFAAKCKAVYLNAGSGTPDETKASVLEWNVRLDALAYSHLFELPCPIYWMPCFEEVQEKARRDFKGDEYGTYYRFRQGDVLPHLSEAMQRFFAGVFRDGRFIPKELRGEEPPPGWLRTLGAPVNPAVWQRINDLMRNMWCTAGFLHAAGLTVTTDGTVTDIAGASDSVFTFDPIEVSCSAEGVTRWKPTPSAKQRFLFHVRNREEYPAAMTAALRSLLQELP